MADIFEEATKKRRQLLELFNTLPYTTIYGVVGPTGASGGKVNPEVNWTLRFNLVAWRTPGSPVHLSPLSVSKSVSETQLKEFQAEIHADSVMAFRGKLCEVSPFGRVEAELTEVLQPPADQELESILTKLKRPQEIVDPELGILRFNRKINWFEGRARWLNGEVDLSVTLSKTGDPSEAIEVMKDVLSNQQFWMHEAMASAVSYLLDNKNDNWLKDGEQPLSENEFIARMWLDSISAHPNGDFDLWYRDGDLFWGHSIQIRASLTKGICGVDIVG